MKTIKMSSKETFKSLPIKCYAADVLRNSSIGNPSIGNYVCGIVRLIKDMSILQI